MSSARGFLGLALVMALAGCPEALRVEGTEPGDCTDGADNDADGLFDCDDATCSGSPDCRGRGDGGSADGGSADVGSADGGEATDVFVATDAAAVPDDAGSTDTASTDAFSDDVFSVDAFSADAFSADAFSADAFSPDAARSPNGASCLTSSTCASGFCVDGVCCNTECTGTCTACTAARRGSGSDGTCGVISGGTDPDDECAASSESSCGNDGSCNGAGACRLWAAGTVCAPRACASGLESRPDTCNGAGTCSDGGTVACTPYVCGPSACRVSCATPSECVSGYTCLAGACYPAHALRIPDASARVMVRDTAGLFTDAFTWETWAVFASSAYSDPTQSLMQVVDINPGNPYALVYLRALYNSFDCVVGTGTGFTIVSTPLAGISTASRTKSPARAPRPSRCSGSMASA